MSKKPERITTQLNLQLARIAAALSIAKTYLNEMPATPEAMTVKEAIDTADRAHDAAFDHMLRISATLSTL